MIFKQYYLNCLAHASYLIGDEETKTAVVVDPQRDIAQYLEDAKKYGLQIKHVFLTHFHADFVAGHLELRDSVQAKIHLGAKAEAEYSFVSESDGAQLSIGGVRLEILETPGHTPEGISILVYDLKESEAIPKLVLTGDTLFIGDVGRPDLMASVGKTADQLASMMYDSLRDKLMKLPDETLMYPAHGAGSQCGKALSEERVSTIGEQKKLNYALRPMEREEFIKIVTENLPQAPDYFPYDAAMNKHERKTLGESLESNMNPLSLEEVLKLQSQGCQVLDTRPEGDFNAAHLKGAVQVSLGGKFASWVGALINPNDSLVVIAEPGSEMESEMRLGRIGFDKVVGFLDQGMNALECRQDLIVSTTCWEPKYLIDRLEKGPQPYILDVRTEAEFEKFKIKEAVNIPLNVLPQRLDEVPTDREIVVHCAGGFRSTIACSLLQRAGLDGVVNLLGGISSLENGSPIAENHIIKE